MKEKIREVLNRMGDFNEFSQEDQEDIVSMVIEFAKERIKSQKDHNSIMALYDKEES